MNVTLNDCECRLYIPTAFSPNQDDINDTFNPSFNCEVESCHLDIYNRWGERVFESDGGMLIWDGTYNGFAVQTGVFLYHIAIQLKNKELLYR